MKPLNQNQIKFRRLPPKEFSAAIGSSITIDCEAGGSPPPSIHWLKNGKRIQQNDFDATQRAIDNAVADQYNTPQVDDVNRIALSSTRSRLFIDCASDSDEAVYTCVAENVYSRISSHTQLNLIRPAQVQATSSIEGDSEVNDLLAGDPVESSNAADGVANGASNSANAQLISVMPQCLSQREQQAPARIHMWTHNIVEIMKNNVVLYCRSNAKQSTSTTTTTSSTATSSSSSLSSLLSKAQSQPLQLKHKLHTQNNKQITSAKLDADDATIMKMSGAEQPKLALGAVTSWTLPDEKQVDASMSDKYEILETGDLLIKDLRWSDMGSYVCTVADEQSSDSVSAFVYPAAIKVKSDSQDARRQENSDTT